ncbi:enoyl-CoA hydratase [Lewinellaceae bacterium SD302]|nr:enoyl-CoA hydratase [Lewinellaceae bacterium SD302]
MSYQNLQIEEKDGIVHLTISRPKALNALNGQTLSELEQFFGNDYAERNDIHGVIMTGAGEKAFVAGADIKEFISSTSDNGGAILAKRGQDVFFLIERFHRPVIAVIHGFALGGGCELAMACHMRIATEAARFGQPEVNLGLIPGYGGTQRLVQLIGKAKATELILTADMIGAQEAHRLGLANHVTSDLEAGVAKATEILEKTGSKGPVAIEESLNAINAYFSTSGFDAEVEAFGRSTKTEDFREGVTAFVEKRKANFTGK